MTFLTFVLSWGWEAISCVHKEAPQPKVKGEEREGEEKRREEKRRKGRGEKERDAEKSENSLNDMTHQSTICCDIVFYDIIYDMIYDSHTKKMIYDMIYDIKNVIRIMYVFTWWYGCPCGCWAVPVAPKK